MRLFLEHIELWLSLAGLAIVWLVPAFLFTGRNAWQVAAMTAIGVGLLHGLIFWLIRRRQRQVRRRAIREIQLMLQDVINNQVQVLLTLSLDDSIDQELAETRRGEIHRTAKRISAMLDDISEESLRDWRDEYSMLDPTGSPEGDHGLHPG